MRVTWIVGMSLGWAALSYPVAAAETPVVETSVVETSVVETPAVETFVVGSPFVDAPAAGTPVVGMSVIEMSAQARADEARQGLLTALAQLRDGDQDAADRSLAAVVALPGFGELGDDEQYQILAIAGRLARERGEPARAHPLLVRASAYGQADGGIWHARLLAASALDDEVDVARCVSMIARRWPPIMRDFDGFAITHLAVRLAGRPEAASERRELLDALFDTGFTVEDESPDVLWLALTQLALDQDHVARAAAVARRIRSPRAVITLQIDRRFDRVVDGAARFELDGVVEADLGRARAVADADPRRLVKRIALQRRLLDAGRFAEALAEADAAIARVADGDGATYYVDLDDEYPWLLDQRASALYGLQRWDEAVAQQRRAARRPEKGRMNVSQALNLGWLYAELGRDEEALEAVEDLGDQSPYGRMQLEMLRLMVAVQREDAAAIERHLAFMQAQRDDAVATYQLALTHADRSEEAAALLIERLRLPKWRSEALSEVQTYLDVPAPPIKAARMARYRATVARADVQAAIAEVGRVAPRIALIAPGF